MNKTAYRLRSVVWGGVSILLTATPVLASDKMKQQLKAAITPPSWEEVTLPLPGETLSLKPEFHSSAPLVSTPLKYTYEPRRMKVRITTMESFESRKKERINNALTGVVETQLNKTEVPQILESSHDVADAGEGALDILGWFERIFERENTEAVKTAALKGTALGKNINRKTEDAAFVKAEPEAVTAPIPNAQPDNMALTISTEPVAINAPITKVTETTPVVLDSYVNTAPAAQQASAPAEIVSSPEMQLVTYKAKYKKAEIKTDAVIEQALNALSNEERTKRVVNATKPESIQKFAMLAPAAGEAAGENVADKLYVPPEPPAALQEPLPERQELSAQTRDQLERVPSNMNAKPLPEGGKISIQRSLDISDLFADDVSNMEETDSNAVGMRLQNKVPQINVYSELEKAYNAMLSGHNPQAIQIYHRVLMAVPADTDALFGLATAYHQVREIEQARIYYTKLLKIDPDHRKGLNNFLALAALESPVEALSILEGLEERNPRFSPIVAQMALIYQQIGEWDQAAQKMLKAVSLDPANVTYLYNLAVIFDSMGKKAEAVGVYGRLIEAYREGVILPADVHIIQKRLTYLRNNVGS